MVDGVAQAEQVLTADPGAWSGEDSLSYSYQWLLCDQNGAGCTEISGADDQTYPVTSDDIGHTIKVQVAATNLEGAATDASDPTDVVRANADGLAGALDTSFGTNGEFVPSGDTMSADGSTGANLADVVQTSNGDLLVLNANYFPFVEDGGGIIGTDVFMSLSRYTADGTLDPTFGDGGTVTVRPSVDPNSLGVRPSSLIVLSDGSIVVAGAAPDPSTNYATIAMALFKFRPDGTLDTNFGSDGVVTTDISQNDSLAVSLAQIPSGGFFVSGFEYPGSGSGGGWVYSDPVLARYDADGDLDPTFGGGAPVVDLSSGLGVDSQGVLGLGLAPNGDPILGSEAFPTTYITRYDATTGAIDTSFGTDGRATISTPNAYDGGTMVIENNGRILVGGSESETAPICPAYRNGPLEAGCYNDVAIWAFQPDGSADTSFGDDGLMQMDLPNASGVPLQNSVFVGLAIQPDGEIIATGEHQYTTSLSYQQTVIVRFNSNGTLDPGWGTNGIATLDQDYVPIAQSPVLTFDGKIVLGLDATGLNNPADGNAKLLRLDGGVGGIRTANCEGGSGTPFSACQSELQAQGFNVTEESVTNSTCESAASCYSSKDNDTGSDDDPGTVEGMSSTDNGVYTEAGATRLQFGATIYLFIAGYDDPNYVASATVADCDDNTNPELFTDCQSALQADGFTVDEESVTDSTCESSASCYSSRDNDTGSDDDGGTVEGMSSTDDDTYSEAGGVRRSVDATIYIFVAGYDDPNYVASAPVPDCVSDGTQFAACEGELQEAGFTVAEESVTDVTCQLSTLCYSAKDNDTGTDDPTGTVEGMSSTDNGTYSEAGGARRAPGSTVYVFVSGFDDPNYVAPVSVPACDSDYPEQFTTCEGDLAAAGFKVVMEPTDDPTCVNDASGRCYGSWDNDTGTDDPTGTVEGMSSDRNIYTEAGRGQGMSSGSIVYVFVVGALDPQALADRFMPILNFSDQEKWRPLNVDNFLAEDFGTAGNYGPHNEICNVNQDCVPITSASQLADYDSPGAYLKFNNDNPPGIYSEPGLPDDYQSPDTDCHIGVLLDCDSGPDSSIYYSLVGPSPGGYEYMEYFFFYRYNEGVANAGNHIGDWEGVTVAPTPDDQGVAFVELSQHGHWNSFLISGLSCGSADDSCGDACANGPCAITCNGAPCSVAGAESDATQVDTYIASGSHANYPSPNSGPGIDGNTDGKAPWGRNGDPDALLPLPGPGGWADWPGAWGNSPEGYITGVGGVGSPCGPDAQSGVAADGYCGADHGDHFAQPWGGPDTNATNVCVSGQCPQTRSRAISTTASQCSSWAGGGVAASLCEPQALTAEVKADSFRSVRASYTIRVIGRLRRAATSSGVAQVIGSPLRPGEKLVVSGRLPAGTTISIETERGTDVMTNRTSTTRKVSGRMQWIVKRSGHSDVRVVAAPGTTGFTSMKTTRVVDAS